MSRKGDCWDNAVAESFFASLKRGAEDFETFESRAQGSVTIAEYIERFYNLQRPRSTIGYLSPVEFELIPGWRSSRRRGSGISIFIGLLAARRDALDELSAIFIPLTTRPEEPRVEVARVASQRLLHAGQALITGCLLVGANALRAVLAAALADARAHHDVVLF
jgi:putative transposase